jgi:hypothetical protein
VSISVRVPGILPGILQKPLGIMSQRKRIDGRRRRQKKAHSTIRAPQRKSRRINRGLRPRGDDGYPGHWGEPDEGDDLTPISESSSSHTGNGSRKSTSLPNRRRDRQAPSKVAGKSKKQQPEPSQEILTALRVLKQPNEIVYVFIKDVDGTTRKKVGYFDHDHLDGLVKEVLAYSGRVSGIYTTLNPISPEVLERSPNQLDSAKPKMGVSDSDVTKRRWLLIDLDRAGPHGKPATAEEKDGVQKKLTEITHYLR